MIPENEIEFLEGLIKSTPNFLEGKMPIQIQAMPLEDFAEKWNQTMNIMLMAAFTKRLSPVVIGRSLSSMICSFVSAFEEEDKVFDMFIEKVVLLHEEAKKIEKQMRDSFPEGNDPA